MGFRDRWKRAGSEPRFEPLTLGEIDWIQMQVKIANLYVGLMSAELQALEPGVPEAIDLMERFEHRELPDLISLGELVDDWQTQPVDERIDVNKIVSAVGVCVGQHIKNQTNLAWIIAIDKQGSELVLSGSPGEFLIYPQALVAKRVVAGEVGFLCPLVQEMIATVNEITQKSQH
jgi:hypothetical protein